MTNIVLFIIIGLIVIIVYWRIRKNFKFIKEPSICLITGGVKTGKSMLGVNLSHKEFFRVHRHWFFVTKFLHKEREEPLYYTNVFTDFGFFHRRLNKCIRFISTEHLVRNCRFNYKSIIFIDECSLMADNMDFNDKKRNIELSLFNKLFAHSTKGGKCYYVTQSPLDSHYSIKRVCSTFFFIQKQSNFGLFHLLYVREMINTDIGVNDFHDDVDTTTRKVIIPFWWHKHYDRYYFSYLTDDLPTVNKNAVLYGDLVSFNPLYVQLADKRKKVVYQSTISHNDASLDNKTKNNPTIVDLYKKKEGN